MAIVAGPGRISALSTLNTAARSLGSRVDSLMAEAGVVGDGVGAVAVVSVEILAPVAVHLVVVTSRWFVAIASWALLTTLACRSRYFWA